MSALHPDTLSPQSPCIGLCTVDETAGWCRGCFRMLDEIACWRDMNPAQRRTVLRMLPHRRATVQAARTRTMGHGKP